MPTKQDLPKSAHPSGDKRFKLLDVAVKRHQSRSDALIEVLHAAQELFGFLDDDVLIYVGRSLGVPLSRVYGVATFYNFFSLKPKGEHTCVVCLGTACYVKGSGALLKALEAAEGIRSGETTRDDKLSLVTARCIGRAASPPRSSSTARRWARCRRRPPWSGWRGGDEQRSA